ncbi:tRNA (N6-isopentenyl adenosine(37)-C2)-methylthiotransferase MiaB [Candidatus Legionella polyplacis]|uniref:tRNA-2-methylthio-N(6)-dimethylallyladenosine synthase n=1 Tax=Candidatus Legionella polyplacis TaxID=2005262 RepID=A0ABZ2H1B3_9GAMM
MIKTLYIKTYGCQMNQYDSDKIFEILYKSHKITLVKNILKADIIILNTCSVREKPQEKIFSELGKLNKIQKKKSNTIIGIGGCLSVQEGINLIKRAPCINIIFGPQTIHKLPNLLDKYLNTKKTVIDINFSETEKFKYLPKSKHKNPTALIPIMEGCNKYCSYCIVPYTRGEEIHRSFDEILKECYELSLNGIKEIILLGQNVNSYKGVTKNGNNADLALLIKYIASIDKIGRIRFLTSHPLEFSHTLINVYQYTNKLVSHIHLPVQSGSDKILKLMKRDYSIKEFKKIIKKIKKIRSKIRISTDIIVGFPGESDEDFQKTIDLVKEIKFDTSFYFIFSPRPGTIASEFQDNISIKTKKQRLKTLQNLLLHYSNKYSQSLVNTIQIILVTNISKKNSQQLCGRTECNRIVNFDGPITLIGHFVKVYITESLPNSLRGRFLKICNI